MAASVPELIPALRPWRRWLSLQQVLQWVENGLLIGLFLAGLLLLISRLVPWATAINWSISVCITCTLLALCAALWYRPSLGRAALQLDKHLELQDRLGTAWELRESSSPLFMLQRQDALTQLGKFTPPKTISLIPTRLYLVVLGIVALALALLLLLPNPELAQLRQQAAFQSRITKEIAAIEHLRTENNSQLATSEQQRKQIDQILRNLESQLQKTNNETQAQQALANAQSQLAQLQNPQAINSAQAQAAASSSLQSSSNSSLSSLGQALASGNSKALSAALKGLASQLNKLSPAQRSQLAQQIEQAANQAGQNPNLSSALHQLAKAAAEGSQSDISDATAALQSVANQESAEVANAVGLNQAAQGLQQAANNLASATDGTTQGQPGQGQGNQGQGNQGQGQGNQGQGQGQGNQGQGQGQGQGGLGQGGSGGGNGAGNKNGKNEQVYVPGQIQSGASSLSNDGSNGVVQPGKSIPYGQIIAQYNQMAHDEIDNSTIPPDLKDLVHSYFNTLEGQ